VKPQKRKNKGEEQDPFVSTMEWGIPVASSRYRRNNGKKSHFFEILTLFFISHQQGESGIVREHHTVMILNVTNH